MCVCEYWVHCVCVCFVCVCEYWVDCVCMCLCVCEYWVVCVCMCLCVWNAVAVDSVRWWWWSYDADADVTVWTCREAAGCQSPLWAPPRVSSQLRRFIINLQALFTSSFAFRRLQQLSSQRLLLSVATDCIFFVSVFFYSVSTITHEPLHLAWWNFARTCTLTISGTLLHFKVRRQGHMNYCIWADISNSFSVGSWT